MSGIYIPNLHMPKNCWSCPFVDGDDGYCHVDGLSRDPNEKTDCPLIPVPDHGDLIDFRFCVQNYEALRNYDGNLVYAVRIAELLKAPTIIPADKDGAE